MQIENYPNYPSRRSPVIAQNMVAASQPLAAQAGLKMLLRGGNAVDAALATAITLTLVEPTGCGLGSDAFAIVWDGGNLHGLNSSGRSPASWSANRFSDNNVMPYRGWESVTVPGAVAGWVSLSEKFGKLPFQELFEPAIHYAESGFAVSPIISQQWSLGADELSDQPGFADNFLQNGVPPTAGEVYTNIGFSKSLKLIAETKGDAFYNGILAEQIDAFAKKHGAALQLSDLAEHRANWSGTISKDFHGISLHEIPPNGQGIAALMALGIISHTPFDDLECDSPLAVHLQIEAIKIALADTYKYVSDLEFMNHVTVSDLLSDDYLKERAGLIKYDQAVDFKAGAPQSGGTVYLSTADQDGMMVSFIQSNYAGFGSGVCIPGTGIHLQNRGAGFSLDPKSPNFVGPKKRPFHTIIPAFLMDNATPLMSFGVMGGPMQAQGHVQMVIRSHLWQQNPQEAIDAPRWRVEGGLDLACEGSMNTEVLSFLSELGHNISIKNSNDAFGFGGAQLIRRLPNGFYIGGSESRKDGHVIGF